MVAHKRGNKINDYSVLINSHTFSRHISIESMLNAFQQSISPINSLNGHISIESSLKMIHQPHSLNGHISIERGLN